MEGNLQQFEQKRRPPPLPKRDEPTISSRKKSADFPISERVEHHVVGIQPGESNEAQGIARWHMKAEAKRRYTEETALPKVIVPEKDRASAEASDRVRSIERLRLNSAKEREFADFLITQFEKRLRDKHTHITEAEMDDFAEKFSASQKELERLQEDARFIPAQEHGGVTNANYDTIRRLERAIAASKFPPQQALGELIHGKVRSVELETEERGKETEEIADTMSEKIEAAYGASPEDLLDGHASFGKRMKFRFKEWLGRVSGQETDFRRWQHAELDKQSAELARNERLPHERKRRFTAEEKQRQDKISLAQQLEAQKAASEISETRAKEKNEWDEMVAEEINDHTSPIIEAKKVSPDSPDAHEIRKALEEYVTPTIETKKVRLSRKERIAIQKAEKTQRDEPEISVSPIGRPAKKSTLSLMQKFEAEHRAARAAAEATPFELTKKPVIAEKPVRRPLKKTAENEAENRNALAEAKKKEGESTWMTVDKAATLVPYSSAIWDRVKKQFEKNPSAVSAFPVEEWPNPKEHPITNYVLLIAKYYEAEKAGDKEQAKRFYTILKNFASALGILEHDMLTIPNKLKPSGIVKRADIATKQERRWKIQP